MFDVSGYLWLVIFLDESIHSSNLYSFRTQNEDEHGLFGPVEAYMKWDFSTVMHWAIYHPHTISFNPHITPLIEQSFSLFYGWENRLKDVKELAPRHLANKLCSQDVNWGRALTISLDFTVWTICNFVDRSKRKQSDSQAKSCFLLNSRELDFRALIVGLCFPSEPIILFSWSLL